jgi:hypothetical protein
MRLAKLVSIWCFAALSLSLTQVGLAQSGTPTPVQAIVAVERAIVFPIPDRSAEPLTFLFEREQVPVLGQTPDGVFLLTTVSGLDGWILSAQVDLIGDLALVPVIEPQTESTSPTAATPTYTPFQASATPVPPPTSAQPPPATPTPQPDDSSLFGPDTLEELPPVVPGKPPPLTITLPDGWEELHIVVPFRTFGGDLHDIPLAIYFGPLPDGARGYIYLYWGFPNVIMASGEYNLWADGVQLLRGSLVGESCNLGVYEQKTFTIGHLDAVGASYQTSECVGETDTAGWFGVVRVYEGTFAFYTAVEPLDAISDLRDNLQAILDSVEFVPPQDD